ncbi:2TM domain-containing protein [Flavobacterium kingsejongi]|uniref:2TM domain-containing protein n=1 Tax=Flavobacterium kingsejongi TaxID=1678728 RepID=A0A2S1LQH7_9FLAO|nr:2TM domain-containing protein [Flavobacterium kingsejongi]AWG25921.1 hypothetical protein FK004_12155 [Flavobacterium kingsejongi]
MKKKEAVSGSPYERARKKARSIRQFYITLTVYCLVMLVLITINLLTTPGELWFQYSAIGWGCGMIFYAMRVFDYNPFLSKGWEERKIQELMAKDKHLHSKENGA